MASFLVSMFFFAFLVVLGLWGCLMIFPPCATEDSTYCLWDASEQGNGEGFDVINFNEDIYITLTR
jgi:hypothetical protein